MHTAKLFFIAALGLLVGGATGILGAWAMPVFAVLVLVSAGLAAVALEARDLSVPAAFASRPNEVEPAPGELSAAA